MSRRGAGRQSVSAALDDLLRALIAQRKRESVEKAITAYYDDLSPEAQAEDKAWGDFSLTEFIEGTN